MIAYSHESKAGKADRWISGAYVRANLFEMVISWCSEGEDLKNKMDTVF